MKRKALGRGLSAILSDKNIQPASNDGKRIQDIAVGSIRVNHMQPRTEFSEDELADLAESIRQQGVLQPLLVRHDPDDSGKFQLIAGERRLRASKRVERTTVPCIVLDAKESQMLEIALIENIQRSNLNPVEEARAYRLMSEQSYLKQEEIARKVGKSRAAVANSMRLLNLPDLALTALENGDITTGHAKCLLGMEAPEQINTLTELIIKDGLSVRECEKRIKEHPTVKPSKPKPVSKTEDQHITDLKRRLESHWNTKVQLKMNGKTKGKIEIQFYDLDHLDDLLKKWNIKVG